MLNIYHMLWHAFPDDLHIARLLIRMLQDEGNLAEAQQTSMQMARNMLARGAAKDATGFLQLCKQLDYSPSDELESLTMVASITEQNDALPDLGRTFSLIHDLSDQEGLDFVRKGTLQKIAAGEDVIRQGDISDSFYLILEGSMEVSLHTETHQRLVLKNLKAGDFFGEFACVYHLPRTATVTAKVPSLLLHFTNQTIHDLTEKSPLAGKHLLQVIRERLVESMTSSHPAFVNVIEDDKKWLAKHARVQALKQGTLNVTQRMQDSCCIVLHGELSAWREVDGKRYSVLFKPNNMFGGVSRYLSVPADIHMAVEERCLLCYIPKQVFRSLILAYNPFETWIQKHGRQHLDAWHVDLPEKHRKKNKNSLQKTG